MLTMPKDDAYTVSRVDAYMGPRPNQCLVVIGMMPSQCLGDDESAVF